MGCAGCSSGAKGQPQGCRSNGDCNSGGCNRLNTFDWLSKKNFFDPSAYKIVEVSFKNGARKSFFWKDPTIHADTGDFVVVDTGSGKDVGQISLSGDLVRIQMKKKRTREDRVVNKVLRYASERDMERMLEARELEKPAMVKARVIARNLGLEMKVGDVEYQADQRKATFYYTADGRVDFRELVRQYAREFRTKIEMRQIGSRQESGRIGGIGSCGRELCCSTWLTDFKSVNTSAARYQNLAINQAKLSGQCGRLKCCLNYELDTYIDALADFPKKADVLRTKKGKAVLIKTDIFKGLMYYAYEENGRRGTVMPVDKDIVKKVLAMNANEELPDDLTIAESEIKKVDVELLDFADVTGDFELPEEKKKKRRKKGRSGRRRKKGKQGGSSGGRAGSSDSSGGKKGRSKSSGSKHHKKDKTGKKTSGENQSRNTDKNKK
ncbi:MAG: regulatory iron-sulfur-containing complex subunit RicT [Saprospiraceae bacterium]|nr:regulatory iron-sulfur-containing complex subunit RicT [Saprospiraceae bacterium]